MTDPTAPVSDRDGAVARLKGKRAFTASVVSYLLANVVVWTLWLFTGTDGSGMPWPLWITGFGAIGLLGQAWNVFGNRPIREADIERELRRGV